jgi:hypothetical protein
MIHPEDPYEAAGVSPEEAEDWLNAVDLESASADLTEPADQTALLTPGAPEDPADA